MSNKIKKTRTRREIGKAIESYRDKEGLLYYFVVPKMYSRESARTTWPIKAVGHHYIGLLRQDKVVIIKYDGIPERALLCDHLRQACESNDIGYQEKMTGNKYRVQQRIGMLRNAGRTLIDVAKRLGN